MAENKMNNLGKDIPISSSTKPKYLASIIYDNKNDDKSLIIKDYDSNKQKELAIEKRLNQFYIRNKEDIAVNLKHILNRNNFNKLVIADNKNEVESFILSSNELTLLQKENILEKDAEIRLANAIEEFHSDSFYEDISIEEEQQIYIETLHEIENKSNNISLAYTEDENHRVQVSLDVENLALRTQVDLFNENEFKEEVTLYDSMNEMSHDVKTLDFSKITNFPVIAFEKEIEKKKSIENEAEILLKNHGFVTSDGKTFSFSDEEINSFVLNKSLEYNQNFTEKWTELENKYHELGNTVSSEKLNQATENLVKNKLDFQKSFTDDKTTNRIVTLLQSDKTLLKQSVDHLQRSKMYALLSSAKNELADVRIKSNGLESERESILKGKISDLESRIAPPPKTTLENVNAKVNSASNVRATANALQNVQTKTNVQENTLTKEPVRSSVKKTRSASAELSR